MKKKLFFKSLFLGLTLFPFVTEAQSALHFDGSNDAVTTNLGAVSGNNARTVEAWIKTTANTDPATGGVQNVICDWGSATTGGRFTFNILYGGKLRLEVGGTGVNGNIVVNNGVWHHVAAVYNPSATNKVTMYVDGVLDVQSNFTTTTISTGTTVKFGIGKRVDNINYFNGTIDEVRIWNVAKTGTEIATNMNTEFCATQTGLIGYYKFNNGIASGNNATNTSTLDYSGNNNTGTLNNFALTGATSNYCVSPTLTLVTIDSSVSTSGNTLTANETGASYQWIDCNNANTPVGGATSQAFTPAVDGSYAVIVNKNGCIATSTCQNVVLASDDFQLNNQIKLYPNPSNGIFNLELGTPFNSVITTVTNISGQVIMERNNDNITNLELNLNAPNGIYFVSVVVDNAFTKTFKLIKE